MKTYKESESRGSDAEKHNHAAEDLHFRDAVDAFATRRYAVGSAHHFKATLDS